MKKYKIAVVGATGAVGETILDILAQRKFPASEIYPLASQNSVGEIVAGSHKPIQALADFDFSLVDFAIFSVGCELAAEYVPKAAQHCLVIDNSSCFRQDDDVPLVIPEVNPEAIAKLKRTGIIANPNCSTIQMLVALKPIYDRVGITRINVATYQAVSGSGRAALKELATQTGELLNGKPCEPVCYPQQIAFNVLPHIDAFQENGYTREEMKMVWETQKILDDPAIMVNPTAVRVPVFYGHSEAIHIETKTKIDAATARDVLRQAPGVAVLDEPNYPTPVGNASGQDAVFVGRIREDISHPRGLNLWVVADNLRKGAALNAVQIAELLIARGQ
jgi:aspartate-semialdehyde dehydrogenase